MTTSGMLLLDKPGGVTSHDVVATVRRIMGERRVGHAGTLDPMATGLLIVAIGPATRLLRFVQAATKRYCGTVELGVATDSLDADGVEVERAPVPDVDLATVLAAAASLCGPQRQTPPMVSAVKVNGRRLHELARRGIKVDRPARDVVVESFTVRAGADRHHWDFEVVCSTGTYVRVLASDLARRLGTVGHLSALRRTAIGPHDVSSAVSLDDLEATVTEGRAPLMATTAMVSGLATVVVSDRDRFWILHGQRVRCESTEADWLAAIDERGELVAVLSRRGDSWQPAVVVASDVDAPRR